MKTSKELHEKAARLAALLENRREEYATALLEDKNAKSLLNELTELEAEAQAATRAAEIAERRDAEEMERLLAAEKAKAEKEFHSLVDKENKISSSVISALVDAMEQMELLRGVIGQAEGLRTRYGLSVTPAGGSEGGIASASAYKSMGPLKSALEHKQAYGGVSPEATRLLNLLHG